MLHGAAAHSSWWNGVAPRLASTRRVVTIDLSGHGESGHRDEYHGEVWAKEVAAVIERTAYEPVVVVGHSMGGLVGIAAAARAPDMIAGLVLVDTRLPLQRPLGLPSPDSAIRSYATPEEALDRFRLLPQATSAEPAFLRSVARAGLVETVGGWRWKYHARARHRFDNDQVERALAKVRCPVGYVYGAESELGGPAALAWLESALGSVVVSAEIPGAFHHVPLDRPEACADAIDLLIGRLARTHEG